MPPESEPPSAPGATGPTSSAATVGIVLVLAVLVVGGFVFLNRGGDDDPDQVGQQTSESGTTPGGPGSPLDLPTIDASDFPSDLPSELQSAFPSGLPSGFPTSTGGANGSDGSDGSSGMPTTMPTVMPSGAFPTDPAAQESWFSDYLDQVMPQ